MREDQASIFEWAERTFGPAASVVPLLGRANTEMAELIRAATTPEAPEAIAVEAADVAIVLCRVATMMNVAISFGGPPRDGRIRRANPLRPATGANRAVADLLEGLAIRPHTANAIALERLLGRAFIYLRGVCEACGTTLDVEVDLKMEINLKRRRVAAGNGTGSHSHHARVKEAA
jgi:hypothetical protein